MAENGGSNKNTESFVLGLLVAALLYLLLTHKLGQLLNGRSGSNGGGSGSRPGGSGGGGSACCGGCAGLDTPQLPTNPDTSLGGNSFLDDVLAFPHSVASFLVNPPSPPVAYGDSRNARTAGQNSFVNQYGVVTQFTPDNTVY